VITDEIGGPYGQRCIFVDDLHTSTVRRITGPGGWQVEKDEPWTMEACFELEAKAQKLAALERENRELKATLAAREIDKAKAKGAGKVPAGVKWVIVANRVQDQSDFMTDYFASTTKESILLAFSKHGKDNFAEMRKAAATFEPTKHLGPGRDVYTCRVILQNDVPNCNGSAYWKGTRSHWHQELDTTDGYEAVKFETRAEAEAFIAGKPAPESINFDCGDKGTVLGVFAWDIDVDEVEHREKWSMGHGYYLKRGGQHGDGWEVRKEERSPESLAYMIGAGKYRKGLL
jgi:hypothetical protein